MNHLTLDHVAVGLFVVFFVAGVASTRDLLVIHRAATPPRNRITGAFATVALLVTAAAGWFGFLSARRVLGFDPIPGASIASIIVASAVLTIPVGLRITVQGIRRGRP